MEIASGSSTIERFPNHRSAKALAERRNSAPIDRSAKAFALRTLLKINRHIETHEPRLQDCRRPEQGRGAGIAEILVERRTRVCVEQIVEIEPRRRPRATE